MTMVTAKEIRHKSGTGESTPTQAVSVVALSAESFPKPMRDSFVFYRDWYDALADLPKNDRINALDAVFRYAFYGELPTDNLAKVATAVILKTIDRNLDKWDGIKLKRREAGRKGGLRRAENQANQANQANATFAKQNQANQAYNVNVNVNANVKEEKNNIKKESKAFVIPTVEMIQQYCSEKGYIMDAERFWLFYDAKGWMIGKNKMKSWKSAVGNWAKSEKERTTKTNGYGQIQTTDNRNGSARDAERNKRDREAEALISQLVSGNHPAEETRTPTLFDCE